ncbi:MAG: carbohydrate kinase [Pseudomonadota bacterium]
MSYLICGEALFDCFLDSGADADALRLDLRMGGSPFNVAIGIARLGGQAALLGGISTDMLGERLVRALESERVSTDYLVRTGRRTTLSLVGVDPGGQPSYSFYGVGSADRHVTAEAVSPPGPEIQGLHFGSYSMVVTPVADTFVALAASAGGRFVSIDPNVRPTVEPDLDIWRSRLTEFARAASVLKISSEDLETLYPDADPESWAATWIDRGVRLVVVTDGGDAISAWTSDGIHVRREPPATVVVDAVGAGDSFQAALLARLAANGDPAVALAAMTQDDLESLLDFSARAAAITCSRRGANLPRSQEMVR